MDSLPENADPLEHLAIACAERDEAEKFMFIAMERAKCAETEIVRLQDGIKKAHAALTKSSLAPAERVYDATAVLSALMTRDHL